MEDRTGERGSVLIQGMALALVVLLSLAMIATPKAASMEVGVQQTATPTESAQPTATPTSTAAPIPDTPVAWKTGNEAQQATVQFSSPFGYDATQRTELIYLGPAPGPNSPGPNDPPLNPEGTSYTIRQNTNGLEPMLVGAIGDLQSWDWDGTHLTVVVESINSRIRTQYFPPQLSPQPEPEVALFVAFAGGAALPDPDLDAVFGATNSDQFVLEVSPEGVITVTVKSASGDQGFFKIFIPDDLLAKKGATADDITFSHDGTPVPGVGKTPVPVGQAMVTKRATPYPGVLIVYDSFTYSEHRLATDPNPAPTPASRVFLPWAPRGED